MNKCLVILDVSSGQCRIVEPVVISPARAAQAKIKIKPIYVANYSIGVFMQLNIALVMRQLTIVRH